MPVRENTYYWEYSLEHPEPEVDEEPYVHDKLIITDPEYLAKVKHLRDLLTTYCVLAEIDKTDISFVQEAVNTQLLYSNEHSESLNNVRRKVLEEIDEVLQKIRNIQHTELVAFFKCLGMSHSIYRKKADKERRLAVLETILVRYCKRRKSQYDQLGYTPVTQQALYDSAASRTQGSAGVRKLRQVMERVSQESRIRMREIGDPSELKQSQSEICFHAVTKKSFPEIKKIMILEYKYGSENQDKIPDLVVMIRERKLIIEAKHIRESGGAQDKQINELIKFIRQSEEKPVSYVAFLDGGYFNKFAETSPADKVRKQRDAISRALEEYPNNYFVNTAGLRQLLTDMFSETAVDADG